MTFDSVEKSVQGATPAELYDFVAPSKTWRLTTHESDVVFGGNTYTATSGTRSSIAIPDISDNSNEVTIQIPALHDLAQTYIAGVTMRELLVTITKYHLATSVFLQLWKGYASDINFTKGQASLRVPNGLADALAMDIPSVCAQKLCNHVLYDAQCTVARASFAQARTITAISADGRSLTLNANLPAGFATVISGVRVVVPWSLHGEVMHTASTERRTIIDQPALNVILMQAQMPNGAIVVGDAITVYAGCDHSITTCDGKFANGVNHGGHPYMLPSNIFYTGLITSRYR